MQHAERVQEVPPGMKDMVWVDVESEIPENRALTLGRAWNLNGVIMRKNNVSPLKQLHIYLIHLAPQRYL